MTNPAEALLEELRAIEDPINGGDIVSMDLVDDVTIEDGTARVTLVLNTPFAPAETEIGHAVREIVAEAGFEPELHARAGAKYGFDEEVLPRVRNVVAVASGKGGVGKTTVAANLAAGLADRGASVGVLDADIHGPNVPRLFGIEEEPGVTPDTEMLVPPSADGVKVMSMAFLVAEPDDPAIMRGPMMNKVMTHFLENVEWGDLDYLIVDLPPGTGDASLDLIQTLPVAGTVIVTTPQQMALDDARKGLRLFRTYDTPILGLVENMSVFECPSCGDLHELYAGDGADAICDDYDVAHLGTLPIHQDFGAATPGPAIRTGPKAVRDRLEAMVATTADELGAVNRRRVANPDAIVQAES